MMRMLRRLGAQGRRDHGRRLGRLAPCRRHRRRIVSSLLGRMGVPLRLLGGELGALRLQPGLGLPLPLRALG